MLLFQILSIAQNRLNQKFEAIISVQKTARAQAMAQRPPPVRSIVFVNRLKSTSSCPDIELGRVRRIWTLLQVFNRSCFPSAQLCLIFKATNPQLLAHPTSFLFRPNHGSDWLLQKVGSSQSNPKPTLNPSLLEVKHVHIHGSVIHPLSPK